MSKPIASSLKSFARSAAADALQRAAAQLAVPLTWARGSKAAGNVGILSYHRVAEKTPGVAAPTINVTPAQFRRQMTGLLSRGLAPLSLQRLIELHQCGQSPAPGSFVVTFDDGYATVNSAAWPVLQELAIPATVFINTVYLDAERFPFDAWAERWSEKVEPQAYRPLTSAECQAMQAEGLITLGAHTHTHSDFRGKPAELRQDLETNVTLLRERFDLEQVPFAFPYGRKYLGFVSDELVAAARDAGVTCALTTEAESVDVKRDPFDWGRFTVYDHDSAATIAAKLAGWYSWAPRFAERLSGAQRASSVNQSAAQPVESSQAGANLSQ